jgi:hypothetical protein
MEVVDIEKGNAQGHETSDVTRVRQAAISRSR